MATGNGAKLVGRLGGGNANVKTYFVPSTDSTALYVGDFVSSAATGAMDTNSQVAVVTRATAGHSLVGVIVGFEPDPSLPYTGKYRAASTARYVQVCNDPDAIYEIQEDADGGAVSAQAIAEMQNADIIVAAGSTVTGTSGTMLDSNTAAATSAQLKILGVRRDGGVNAGAASAGALLLVKIFEHALVRVDSVAADGSITE